MIVFCVLLLIFAVVFFTAMSVVYKRLRNRSKNDSDSYVAATARKVNIVRFVVPIVAIVIMLLIFMLIGIRTIDSTEIGVVRTFGRIDHTVDSGLNFINPFTDSIDIYDMRVHVRESSFATYTKDAQPVTAAIEYQFELTPDRVMEIAADYGNQEILESKLGNVIEEKAKIVFSRYSAMPLLEARSGLSAEVEAEMTELEERYGVKFSSVIVRDIDFSDAFEASVEAKMTAEQKALTAEQEKKAALVKAEEKAEVAKIDAEAEIARARGEAEALQITREALNNMPDAWIMQQFLEKWDGKLPKITTNDGGSLLITPDFD